MVTKDSYLIEEYGYYRSGNDSYTGLKNEAKRFTLAEVAEVYPPEFDVEDFIHIPEDEAPYFSRDFKNLMKNQLKDSKIYNNNYIE